LFVHFPLGLLLGGVVVEMVGWLKRIPSLRKAGLLLMTSGLVVAVPAVATGFLAYGRVDHGETAHALMTAHRNLMLAALALFAAAVAWRWRAGEAMARRPWSAALYAGLLAAATGTLVVGGTRGADLVFAHATGLPSSRLEEILDDRHAEHGHRHSEDAASERMSPASGDKVGSEEPSERGDDEAGVPSRADTSGRGDDSARPAHKH
jgi:uncharacterized membrane protein